MSQEDFLQEISATVSDWVDLNYAGVNCIERLQKLLDTENRKLDRLLTKNKNISPGFTKIYIEQKAFLQKLYDITNEMDSLQDKYAKLQSEQEAIVENFESGLN